MKNIIWIILFLAFMVRMVGINYGLPLWLIGDEPPFLAASLKMLETKVFIPALHPEFFKSFLYFPPYLSYLYLPIFSLVLVIEYIFSPIKDISIFKNIIVSDLSIFFIMARFINIIFSLITIYLVYKIYKNIFGDKNGAIWPAYFLSFSALHINLSSVARDWMPATLLFTLGILILSDKNIEAKVKYPLVGLVAGIANGVNLMAPFLMLFTLYWYLFYETNSLKKAFREKYLYATLIIFTFLYTISIAIYPYGFHLSGDNSISGNKNLIGLFFFILNFFKSTLISEPLLILFSMIGIYFLYNKKRGLFLLTLSFITSYISIFYFVFHYQQRFTIYLFPLLAILAGYGLNELLRKLSNQSYRYIIYLILTIPIIYSIRLDLLLLKNDSRIEAINWVEKNIKDKTKVMAYATLTRLQTNSSAIKEQLDVDPDSLRQIDKAELFLNKHGIVNTNRHVLNLYTINNQTFFNNVAKYAIEKEYGILLIQPSIIDDQKLELEKIRQSGKLIKSFGADQETYSIGIGNFGSLLGLLELKSLGPKIEIYDLQTQATILHRK